MRLLMSKICARLDAYVDVRSDWPALLASATLLAATAAIFIALVVRPARAAEEPLAERIDWAIAAVICAAPRTTHVADVRPAQIERSRSRRYAKSTKRQRPASHKRRRG